MIKILRVDPEILAILPDMLFSLIPTQRLPHIEGIFPIFSSRRIVAVVIYDTTKHAIAESVDASALMVSPHCKRQDLIKGASLIAETHPILLYIPTAVLLPSRTNKSTNQAFFSSQPCSSDLVSVCAMPRRRY